MTALRKLLAGIDELAWTVRANQCVLLDGLGWRPLSRDFDMAELDAIEESVRVNKPSAMAIPYCPQEPTAAQRIFHAPYFTIGNHGNTHYRTDVGNARPVGRRAVGVRLGAGVHHQFLGAASGQGLGARHGE